MHAYKQILLKAPQCAFLYSYCSLRLCTSMHFTSFIVEPGRIVTCAPHASNASIGVSLRLKGYNVQDPRPGQDCHDPCRYTSYRICKSYVYMPIYTLHPTFIAASLSGTQATSWALCQDDCGAPANRKNMWFHWCTQDSNASNRSFCSDVGVSISNESLHDMQERIIDSV